MEGRGSGCSGRTTPPDSLAPTDMDPTAARQRVQGGLGAASYQVKRVSISVQRTLPSQEQRVKRMPGSLAAENALLLERLRWTKWFQKNHVVNLCPFRNFY